MKSLKELYKIGRGPSSSHTIGPDKACRIIKSRYPAADYFKVTLYGSLAATGKGHLTDKAVIDAFLPEKSEVIFDCVRKMPHPNTMKIEVFTGGIKIGEKTVESVGGGAIRILGEEFAEPPEVYPHKSFSEIADFCVKNNIPLYGYAEIFEGKEIRDHLSEIYSVMNSCIEEGLGAEGILPGGIGTERKAKTLYSVVPENEGETDRRNRLVCAYAFAAAEQNAGGGRVVTAPTCGSCGVLPAVLKFCKTENGATDNGIINALSVAGIIGNLAKTNASISGAECGCQAEIGVACAMASAAVATLSGMDISQTEYCAEIAVEHHLGLTCDPVCGLVQIPCIERNAVAAMRSLNEFTIAKFLSGSRKISLDLALKTMYETGKDLRSGYRETAKSGLAKNYF